MPETIWIQTNRRCSCCGSELLWARVTGPDPPFEFGKRLYTYCCRVCDFSPFPGDLPTRLRMALRSDTGYDPRDDPELLD